MTLQVMRPSSGPESPATLAEDRLVERWQFSQDQLLDEPIQHRRYAQRLLPAVAFGDPHPFDRAGDLAPFQQFPAYRQPMLRQVAP